MFKPDRWTVTAYWRNPAIEDLPPYDSQTWTYYREQEAQKMADKLFAGDAAFIYTHAWDRHTGKLVRTQVAP